MLKLVFVYHFLIIFCGGERISENEKRYNNTHIQFISGTFPNHSDSRKENLWTQFSKKNVTVLEETKYNADGFVNNSLYFRLHFRPNKSDQKGFLMSPLVFEMIEKIVIKKLNITSVPANEEIMKNIDTSKRNEKKSIKKRNIPAVIADEEIRKNNKTFRRNEKKFNKDLDATKCNYGKHYEENLNWCNCSNVLGNETHCEIKKLFNSTHIQFISATFLNHSYSWKENLWIQFPKDNVTILEETKHGAYGFVNNDLYFHIQFHPNKSDKKDFLMPRLELEMIEKIVIKKLNITSVPAKEEIRENIDTSKRNEKKSIKKRNITDELVKEEIRKTNETFRRNDKKLDKEHFNAGESIYNFGSVIKLMMGIISAFVIQHYL